MLPRNVYLMDGAIQVICKQSHRLWVNTNAKLLQTVCFQAVLTGMLVTIFSITCLVSKKVPRNTHDVGLKLVSFLLNLP